MKNALRVISKLLLVLAIFLGLQGKVLVRYTEIFQKYHRNEITHPGKTQVKATIIRCKLQCYTQRFHTLHPPVASVIPILVMAPVIAGVFYICFKENFPSADPIRLLPLRAPPAC